VSFDSSNSQRDRAWRASLDLHNFADVLRDRRRCPSCRGVFHYSDGRKLKELPSPTSRNERNADADVDQYCADFCSHSYNFGGFHDCPAVGPSRLAKPGPLASGSRSAFLAIASIFARVIAARFPSDQQ
jgi:hypothetical protein